MSFQPTASQATALGTFKLLVRAPHDRPRVMVLRGVAGTGKTTMIKLLHQEVGDMAIVAPTGKAAQRVTEATMLPAMTIHRFIYAPKEDPFTGMVTFSRKNLEDIKKPTSGLIVVEEASMVGAQMWDDIYSVATELECHILCVGDPFQLPPVEEKNSELFGVLLPNFRFDFEANLLEITRQALESPIIRAATKIREGDPAMGVLELPRVRMADLMTAHAQILKEKGVVIVHRNSSRKELNSRIRKHLLMPEKTLDAGEPLLVMRNNYALQRFNGEVLQFDGWKRLPGKQWEIYDRWKQTVDHASFGLGVVEGDECAIVPQAVFGRLETVSVNAIDQVAKTAVGKDYSYLHCNLGYTLTAHKSQGSEWKKVLVVVERSAQPYTKDGQRWLYTAVTRAKEECRIVWLAGTKDEQIT